jgi:hypothetical protein
VCAFAYPEIGRQMVLKPLAVLGTATDPEAVNA